MASTTTGPRSKRVRAVEKRFGEPLEVTLRRLYYEDRLTLDQVATKLRIPRGTLGNWMIRFGINQRAVAEKAASSELIA